MKVREGGGGPGQGEREVKRKKGGREERKEKERSICESISSPNVNTLKKFYLVSMVSIDSHQLDLTENPFGC
jgi:hypothetical protein